MKTKMKTKELVILFIVFMTIMVVFMGIFVHDKNQKLSAVMESEKNATKNEQSSDTETFTNSKGEKIIVKIDEEKETMKDIDAMLIQEKAKSYMSDFNFLNAHEFIQEESLKYNKDALPDRMTLLLKETAEMSNFEGMMNSGTNKIVIEMIKDFKDVDNFLFSTLYLSDSERRFIIESTDSINPIFYGGVKDVKKEEITNSYEQENIEELNNLKNVEQIYKHEFVIEGNTVFSYIARVDGSLKFIKMIPHKNNKMQYYTIKEWDLLFN